MSTNHGDNTIYTIGSYYASTHIMYKCTYGPPYVIDPVINYLYIYTCTKYSETVSYHTKTIKSIIRQ